MSTIDEILASGRYTDRRGKFWLIAGGEWFQINAHPHQILQPAQMRLLIERDQHREACEGADCGDHPVPIVRVNYIESGCVAWEIVPSGSPEGRLLAITHAEAMDAARALAVTP